MKERKNLAQHSDTFGNSVSQFSAPAAFTMIVAGIARGASGAGAATVATVATFASAPVCV